MKLNELQPAEGAVKDRKRVGRGPGSGNGKTSGRGEKGQKSRSGYKSARGFEGGQMPLHRRLPKRGFTNVHAARLQEVNLAFISKNFQDGETVSLATLLDKKLVDTTVDGIVVLNKGELTRKVTVAAVRVTKGAREAIQAAGGTIQEPASEQPAQ